MYLSTVQHSTVQYRLHQAALDSEVLLASLLLAVDVVGPADHLPALDLLLVVVREVEGQEGQDRIELGSVVILGVQISHSQSYQDI